MKQSEVENIVGRLSNLIDKCENDFEEMVFNPDTTFELLIESHAMLSRVLKEM